jgi:hypothetical protein
MFPKLSTHSRTTGRLPEQPAMKAAAIPATNVAGTLFDFFIKRSFSYGGEISTLRAIAPTFNLVYPRNEQDT